MLPRGVVKPGPIPPRSLAPRRRCGRCYGVAWSARCAQQTPSIRSPPCLSWTRCSARWTARPSVAARPSCGQLPGSSSRGRPGLRATEPGSFAAAHTSVPPAHPWATVATPEFYRHPPSRRPTASAAVLVPKEPHQREPGPRPVRVQGPLAEQPLVLESKLAQEAHRRPVLRLDPGLHPVQPELLEAEAHQRREHLGHEPLPPAAPHEHIAQLRRLVWHVPAEEPEIGEGTVVVGVGQHPERGLPPGDVFGHPGQPLLDVLQRSRRTAQVTHRFGVAVDVEQRLRILDPNGTKPGTRGAQLGHRRARGGLRRTGAHPYAAGSAAAGAGSFPYTSASCFSPRPCPTPLPRHSALPPLLLPG